MTTITEFMTPQHRDCDDLFTTAQESVAQNNLRPKSLH